MKKKIYISSPHKKFFGTDSLLLLALLFILNFRMVNKLCLTVKR